MSIDDVVRVRYAPGVVGETKRVLHVAVEQPTGAFFAMCETTIEAGDAEILHVLTGMPCMVCTRVMALRSRAAELAQGEPTELGAARPGTVS